MINKKCIWVGPVVWLKFYIFLPVASDRKLSRCIGFFQEVCACVLSHWAVSIYTFRAVLLGLILVSSTCADKNKKAILSRCVRGSGYRICEALIVEHDVDSSDLLAFGRCLPGDKIQSVNRYSYSISV